MNDQYLFLDANFVKAEIAKLIEAYPELADDDALRADTIEGETNAFRVIERALSERQEAEMMAGAIKEREADLASRRGRFERKSDAMRSLIRNVMKAAGLPKVQLTEASISLTKPQMSVGISSLEDIPQGYVKFKREADKTAIREALANGQEVPGAFMVLGSEGLRIQPK